MNFHDHFLSRTFDAVLFDMDGTILTSIKASERVWGAWALQYGLDLDAFLPTIHGVRAIDTIRRLNLPGIDAEVEAAKIMRAEIDDTEGVEPIAGAAHFLASLPADRWAVATSAPRALAERRISAAGLPMPPQMITAEDVTKGKPAPDCFLKAARRLGVDPVRCLAFEDAPAGITAAETAGCTVVIITATHAHPLSTHHVQVSSYSDFRVAPGSAAGISFEGRLAG
ncbi:HAD-IA family hydrolase [Georhizobium sp. MAB10]|uniref:HAD-IA family hydrolase n=1 Tax=Georhizobium sp. MAB10 TaxID=3028319 RepID=UPI0038560B5A